VPGVHSAENRGVLKETKNVIAISAIVMDMDESESDIDMEVEVAIDIPVVVAVDMEVISDMSILASVLIKQRDMEICEDVRK
jgi:hypothetical protein